MAKRNDTKGQTTIYTTQKINDRAKRTPLKPGGFQITWIMKCGLKC